MHDILRHPVFARFFFPVVFLSFFPVLQVPAQSGPQAGNDIGSILFTKDEPSVIRAISVEGNQRIEAETVISYLPLQVGMSAEKEFIDLSLKTLFATGLFADIRIAMVENGILLITVRENPIVNRVVFEGNRKLKDDDIVPEIQLAPRVVYTRSKVQSDVQRLIELYRAKGRFAATVTPMVTPLEQNRVDVVYEIDEGPRTGVARVNFIGNSVFTDNQLRDVLLTKESRWWRFFSSNDNYDPDRIEYERELLRQFYGKNGYADFSVLSVTAELTQNRSDFFITFTVDEGPRYTVGEVSVKTTLDKLDSAALERFVPIRTGQVFNGERLENVVESIIFATGSSGYAFVDVYPRLTRHPGSKTVDITFEVNEGPRVYVERININGNIRTLDDVIRREIRLSEGDPFNRILVDRSQSRIRSLGYFSDVQIGERAGSAPDRTILDVDVEEQSTGSFSIGVGVSSSESFIVDLSVEERNLLGRGQFLRFRVQSSSRTRQVDLRFTQPYAFNRNLSAGGSLFNQRTDFEEAGFIRDRMGAGINTGFQASEYGRIGLDYLLTRDQIQLGYRSYYQYTDAEIADLIVPGAEYTLSSLDSGGNPYQDGNGRDIRYITALTCDFLLEELTPGCDSSGKFLTSLLGTSLSFSRLDNPMYPRRGWRWNGVLSVAGIGGDVRYYQTEMSGGYYRPLPAGFTGSLKGRAGWIDGYGGDEVRLSDRFFEGASSFRGFEVAGVGPRYIEFINQDGNYDGQSLGGNAYAIGTAEILLPLPIPEEYGIRISAFSDFGAVGILDENAKRLNDPAYLDLLTSISSPGDPNNILPYLDFDGDGSIDILPVQDAFAFRLSAGISVSWRSPFGPVRFDFSEVFIKEDYDQTEGFRFSAGTSF